MITCALFWSWLNLSLFQVEEYVQKPKKSLNSLRCVRAESQEGTEMFDSSGLSFTLKNAKIEELNINIVPLNMSTDHNCSTNRKSNWALRDSKSFVRGLTTEETKPG